MNSSSDIFLKKLLATPSPCGGEKRLAEVFCDYLRDVGKVEVDPMLNSYCTLNFDNEVRLMLEAHSDEVGFQVTYISEDGYVYFRRNGCADGMALLGRKVIIEGKSGPVVGIVGKKPVHLMGADEGKPVPVEEMWIDIFASNRKEAESQISVGDFVTVKSEPMFSGTKVVSKALDDKIGVYIIAEAMRRIADLRPEIGICACAASQEEVGCRGAVVAANRIRPEYAICVDTGFATDFPGMPEAKYGVIHLGEGVVINHSCDNNKEFTDFLLSVARGKEIPHQLYTNLAPTGGTDTANIQISGKGVKTALLSIPCRYMHTPVEVCDLRDVESAVALIVAAAEGLSSKSNN